MPLVLYVDGDISCLRGKVIIGVVGTRKPCYESTAIARSICGDMAKAGAIVVSGGALGIDSAAHEATLDAGGKTVCVMGCGLGTNYLMDNEAMRRRISKNGALITEYPPMKVASRITFPERNRIISGMSHGVLVVEAGEKSGSLITARCAAEQGREVFAIPGSILTSAYTGANNLIRDGARVALCARDIIAVRNDKGIDFDKLAEAELNSDLDINILRSYGVAPAAYIAEPVQREEIGRLEPTPVKSERKKKSAATPKKEHPAPEPEEPQVQPSRLPEGMMRDILESMPIGTPVSADFFAGFALDPGKLVGYISMLEVSGYITSIPGGTYLRKF
jgi:DNA processing protein